MSFALVVAWFKIQLLLYIIRSVDGEIEVHNPIWQFWRYRGTVEQVLHILNV